MSDYVVAAAEMNGMKITIWYDECADDPRKYNDCLGTMACFHKRYSIGDETHKNEDPFEFQDWVTTSKDVATWFPIYMLDHSGLTIRTYSFDDPWDSGLLGYIYVTKEKVRKEYGVKRISSKLMKKVDDILIAEVEEMDYYLRGEVYCLEAVKGEETFDAVCGIFGYKRLREYLKTELPEEFQPVVEKLDL